MPLFTPAKALRDLPKTPVILNVILHGVDDERARKSTDGVNGWSVTEVICHMNDFEAIFIERVRRALDEDQPALPGFDQEELAKTNRYREQVCSQVFASYVSRRREFLALLRGLTPEQWQRQALYPDAGLVSVAEIATNVTLHDVNHIEQVIKALGISADLRAL